MKALIVAAALFFGACGSMTQYEANQLAEGLRQAGNAIAAAPRPVSCYQIGYLTQCY